jgi:hypothetical protein
MAGERRGHLRGGDQQAPSGGTSTQFATGTFCAGCHGVRFFGKDPLAAKWHLIQTSGAPPVQICLSPHSDSALSLGPVASAIDQATSSVVFAIAFLYQTSKTGLVRAAVNRLTGKPLFSYGISDKGFGFEVKKPDGSDGIVPFDYLKKNTAPPFSAEWGGAGIHEHNKFVVADFNLPTAKVFTGSCNLSESGEAGNGDHLIMIQDPRVATSYTIQAVLIFDHLHFASKMNAIKTKTELTLQKPLKFSKANCWYATLQSRLLPRGRFHFQLRGLQ